MKALYAGRFYPSGVRGRLPRLLEGLMVKRLGAVPGIARVQLADLRLAYRMSRLFQHVYMGRRVTLTVGPARDGRDRGQRPDRRRALTRSPLGGLAPPHGPRASGP